MIGLFIASKDDEVIAIAALDQATRDWEMRAARGECGWICADCCMSFADGMPDACACGHQSCTDIIQRDRYEAAQQGRPTTQGTAAPTDTKGGA